MRRALSLKQRHASSLALQVLTKHCFCGDYSRRFRPTAGDNLICPFCSRPSPSPCSIMERARARRRSRSSPSPSTSVDVRARRLAADQHGFDTLQAEFLRPSPAQSSPSPPPYNGGVHVRRHNPGSQSPSPPSPLVDAHARRPPHDIQHSAHHAIFSCPASSALRAEILGPAPTSSYLFHMDK